MPCYEIILNRVDLGKAQGKLLDAAMKDIGYVHVAGKIWSRNGQRVEIDGSQLRAAVALDQMYRLANEIKVAYSKQVVGYASRAMGWNVKSAGQNSYVMEKR